ncbi:MAG TPA: (5-formylfuran-3-yl)methyl phosphate synthase [Anaerolineae bacterium]|nr:(5-formylfuran-3-yl)methyl phosphate synthase [Anaerolineae bacterium]
MQLLISATNAVEAQAALQGGADIMDVKNPAEGALGAANVAALRDICS